MIETLGGKKVSDVHPEDQNGYPYQPDHRANPDAPGARADRSRTRHSVRGRSPPTRRASTPNSRTSASSSPTTLAEESGAGRLSRLFPLIGRIADWASIAASLLAGLEAPSGRTLYTGSPNSMWAWCAPELPRSRRSRWRRARRRSPTTASLPGRQRGEATIRHLFHPGRTSAWIAGKAWTTPCGVSPQSVTFAFVAVAAKPDQTPRTSSPFHRSRGCPLFGSVFKHNQFRYR